MRHISNMSKYEYGKEIYLGGETVEVTAGYIAGCEINEDGSVSILDIYGKGEVISGLEVVRALSLFAVAKPVTKSHAQDYLKLLGLMKIRAKKRVCERLLTAFGWLQKYCPPGEDKHNNLRVTHEFLAQLCDTTRVTVTREIKYLEASGAIIKRNRTIQTNPNYYERKAA